LAKFVEMEDTNEYEAIYAAMSTEEIFRKWIEQRHKNHAIPNEWYQALKSHVSRRKLTYQQQRTFEKLCRAEEQAQALLVAVNKNESGLAKPDINNLSVKTAQFSTHYEHLLQRLTLHYYTALLKLDRLLNPVEPEEIPTPAAKPNLEAEEKAQLKTLAGDRDQLIVEHVLSKSLTTEKQELPIDHASSHLGTAGHFKYTDYKVPVALRDFNEGAERIVFVMCPSWGVIFPPYGLAKMVGTLRQQNFACKVYDLNLQVFHHLLHKTGVDYWRAEKYFYWENPLFYKKYLADDVNPYLQKAVEAILADKPSVVGFSLYSTNIIASLFMMKELKRRMPYLSIVAGGPAVAISTENLPADFNKYVNYFFRGEAEETFIEFLRSGKHLEKFTARAAVTTGSLTSRIALDEKAFADYSDYDITAYTHADGASLETSRGCVAQCSFCSETNFWKFRSMTPERVIAEMKNQINSYGFKRFWFVDSLVNGDLKNFGRLVDLMVEHKLNVTWNSYSRCDGRMTKEFIDKVAASGCMGLSYGVESGSQKVLNDMRKKIEVWEIYNNLRDTYNTNQIWTHVNWLIGFPTEENIDYYHSNILIFNVRKYIHHISPGMGCGISELTDLYNRPTLYGIPWNSRPWENSFLGNWYTEGFKNTQLNRFVRVKLFHLWLEILQKHAGSVVENSQRHEDIENSYWFYTDNEPIEGVIDATDYIDFNRVKSNSSISFINANTANDYLAFFYGLYECFKAFKIRVVFNPSTDRLSWGNFACNYRADVNFETDNEGNYHCHISHRLKHEGSSNEKRHLGDMSFKGSFTLSGNLADWKTTEKMTGETIHEVYRNARKKTSPSEQV